MASILSPSATIVAAGEVQDSELDFDKLYRILNSVPDLVIDSLELTLMLIKFNAMRFAFRPGFKSPERPLSGAARNTIRTAESVRQLIQPCFLPNATPADKKKLIGQLEKFLEREYSAHYDFIFDLWVLWGNGSKRSIDVDDLRNDIVVDMYNMNIDGKKGRMKIKSTPGWKYGVLTPRAVEQWLIKHVGNDENVLSVTSAHIAAVLMALKLWALWDSDSSGDLSIDEIKAVISVYNKNSNIQLKIENGKDGTHEWFADKVLTQKEFLEWLHYELPDRQTFSTVISEIVVLIECTFFFDALDYDGRGTVSRDKMLYARHGVELENVEAEEKEALWEAMKVFDKEGKGSLNRHEFREYCQAELKESSEEDKSKFLEECTANAKKLYAASDKRVNEFYIDWLPKGAKSLSLKDIKGVLKKYNGARGLPASQRLAPPTKHEYYTPRQIESWLVTETVNEEDLEVVYTRMAEICQRLKGSSERSWIVRTLGLG